MSAAVALVPKSPSIEDGMFNSMEERSTVHLAGIEVSRGEKKKLEGRSPVVLEMGS